MLSGVVIGVRVIGFKRGGQLSGRTPVGDVVSVYTGEDHVINPPVCHCFGGVFRLHRVQGPWCPGGLNSAEAAAPAESEIGQLPKSQVAKNDVFI